MSLADSNQEPPALTEAAQSALESFRQGDVVKIGAVPVISSVPSQSASPNTVVAVETRPWWRFWQGRASTASEAAVIPLGMRTALCPEGLAVVISQSCDLTNSDRLTAQIAPLVRLDGTKLSEAKAGRRPRYVAVPQQGDDAFADLESIATIDKAYMAELERAPGLRDSNDMLDFARGVGRRFSRFAFPGPVVHALGQLQKIVKNKYGRQGALGKALGNVAMLRVEEAEDWSASTYRISLHVVLEEGVLPVFHDDEFPKEPASVRRLVYDSEGKFRATPQQVAEAILKAKDEASVHWLWHHFATAMATACLPAKGLPDETYEAVLEVGSQIFSIDEYVMAMYRRSVELDLDYLSDSRPL